MYSTALIEEVKELYPDSLDINVLAANGSPFLGRWLDDSSSDEVDSDMILQATSLEELQKEVILLKRKRELYHKWCKESPGIQQ